MRRKHYFLGDVKGVGGRRALLMMRKISLYTQAKGHGNRPSGEYSIVLEYSIIEAPLKSRGILNANAVDVGIA